MYRYKYKLMRRYFEGWCKFIREKDAIKTREEIRKRLESKEKGTLKI